MLCHPVSCCAMCCVMSCHVLQWRTQFRKDMNRSEAQANNRAIDSLINYETVKYCGNEEHEVQRYDECMRTYQVRRGPELFDWGAPCFGWVVGCGVDCVGREGGVQVAHKLLPQL